MLGRSYVRECAVVRVGVAMGRGAGRGLLRGCVEARMFVEGMLGVESRMTSGGMTWTCAVSRMEEDGVVVTGEGGLRVIMWTLDAGAGAMLTCQRWGPICSRVPVRMWFPRLSRTVKC